MSVARFNSFLESVDLARYREKYSQIKLVELDLPRNIQAIRFLYRDYWDNRPDFYPSFEKFYDDYSRELAGELEEFRRRMMFSHETFYRGLPARIYRTWASLLTQIQGGHVAEAMYGCDNIEMNAELDYGGVDMRILHGGEEFNIQIKKETMSREVRQPWQHMRRNIKIITVYYEVPGCGPLTSTGKQSVPFGRWRQRWEGRLKRMDNGFVIFLPGMFCMDNIKTP